MAGGAAGRVPTYSRGMSTLLYLLYHYMRHIGRMGGVGRKALLLGREHKR